MTGLGLYYRSLKHLKSKQVFYRVYYKIRSIKRRLTGFKYDYAGGNHGIKLSFQDFPLNQDSYTGKGTFTFLNKEHTFDSVDWDYPVFGKLWTYNLNYFDFINQEKGSFRASKILMEQFRQSLSQLQNANEPYPISLRIINWVKFLSKHQLEQTVLAQSLDIQTKILLDQREYHLLGNHLLENGFALLFAAYFFKNDDYYEAAEKIIKAEIKEQVLNDGAHFELSPMYHQIILHRLLDAYNLVKNNDYRSKELLPLFKQKASAMLAWLAEISFEDGSIPMLNDAAYNIALSTNELINYAGTLGLSPSLIKLSDSGYRKWKSDTFEMIIDIGQIGPSYIPGHAHADTFNFVMHAKGQPLFVDPGTSTYETNALRLQERSTKMHNTVEVDQKNSSEIWASFRVGDRAGVKIILDEKDKVVASHNGYGATIHQRSMSLYADQIIIEDQLNNSAKGIARFHLHPSIIDITISDLGLVIKDINISFCNENGPIKGKNISIKGYKFASGFNQLLDAKVIEIGFTDKLITTIKD